jgi:hypothetical protein
MAYKPFKMKGSPVKFIGMGLSKMIRDKARGTKVGNFMEKVAGSGMLGVGGALLAGGQNDQGMGEAMVPPHTHEDETAMVKKGTPYTPYKMKGSPMKRNFPEAFEDKNTPMMNNEDVYKKADALYEAADKAHKKAMKIGDEPHMQKRKKHLQEKSKSLLDENYEEEMRVFRESQSKQ